MADLAEPDCSPMHMTPPVGMRWIPGGTFRMGEDGAYPEEAPAHNVKVSGFWIDEYAVTNADFAAFVKATGYRFLSSAKAALATMFISSWMFRQATAQARRRRRISDARVA